MSTSMPTKNEMTPGEPPTPMPDPSRFGRADPSILAPRYEPDIEPEQTPQRRWRPVALACALGLLLGAGAGWAAAHTTTSDTRKVVLVATRDLQAGATLTVADVRSTTLEVGVVETLGTEVAADAVGQVLRVPVAGGAPLTVGVLTPAPRPGRGQVLVPLQLPAGQAPLDSLVPGTRVRAVAVTPAALTAPTSREGAAVIASVRQRLPRPGSTLASEALVSAVHTELAGATGPGGSTASAPKTLVVELVVSSDTASALLEAAQSGAVSLLVTGSTR